MTALPSSAYVDFTDRLHAFDTPDAIVLDHQVWSNHQFTRSPYLNLSQAISQTSNVKISMCTIYADTLDFNADDVLVVPASLKLFARALFRDASKDKPVKVKLLGSGSVALYTAFPGINNKQIPFVFETLQGTVTAETAFTTDCVGFAFAVDSKGNLTSSVLRNPPNKEFDVATLEDLIRDDGRLAEQAAKGFGTPDNLSRLLQYQMLLATTCQEDETSLALDISQFVARVTYGIPKAFQTYLQASTYLCSLAVTGASPTVKASFVPSLDLSVAECVLKSRLAAAMSFEDAYRKFASEEASSTNVRLLARIALEASEDTQKTYEVIGERTQQRFDEGQSALKLAQERFQDLQIELKQNQDRFKKGIEAWKEEQIKKAVFDVLIVVGSIAAAVVFPPAAAGGLAAGANAIEKGAEVAEKASKMMKIIIKLKELYEKMEPVLKGLDVVFTAIQTARDLMSKFESLDGAEGGIASSLVALQGKADDIFNMRAQWDEFNLEMNSLLDGLKPDDIKGCAEYQLSINKLVVRAKTVLDCQSALAQAADDNLKTQTQLIASQKQSQRLNNATRNLQGQPALFKIYKEHMFERLLHARTWVYLDFKAYLAAYMYFSLDTFPPIKLSVVKPLPHFMNDSAALQAAVAQAEMKCRAQMRSFRFNTKKDEIFSADWKKTLVEEKSLTLTISPKNSVFDRFRRIRVIGVRCYLDGISSDENLVMLNIAHSELLVDKGFGRDAFFVSPSSSLTFEYVSGSGEILVDGKYARPEAFFKPTPFTSWTVSVVDTGVELSEVTKIRLELMCEVSVAR